MQTVYLYIRGQRRELQQKQLQAEFPQGIVVIDKRPPAMLEKLIATAGPEDLIAAAGLEAIPEIKAEDYIALCSRGAGLHLQRQPFLDSAIFAPEINGGDGIQQAAQAIIERQLAAASRAQAQQREKEKAGRAAAAAEGRRGGRKPGAHPITRKEIYLKQQIAYYQQQGLKPGRILAAINEDSSSEYTITHNTLYKYMRELKAQEEQEAEEE